MDGSTNGAGDDGHVEHLGNAPLVAHLPLKGVDLSVVKLVLSMDLLVVVWVLSYQGALLQEVNVLSDALLSSKLLNLGHQLMLGNASKRILNLGLQVVREVAGLDGTSVVDTMLSMRLSVVGWSKKVVSTKSA